MSSLIDSVHYPPNAFTIIRNDGKYIFGITSAPSHELPIAKIIEYKTLYETLCDLDAKVKYSLEMAIKCAYSRSAIKNFHMILFCVVELINELPLQSHYLFSL